MKWSKWYGMMAIALLFTAACQKTNNNSPYPHITLSLFSPDSVRSNSVEDTVFVLLNFFDGDGDLTSGARVKVLDNRNTDSLTFAFPPVDPTLTDPVNGLEGTCLVKIYGPVLRVRPDTLHTINGDTTTFRIHIVDVAGNESNRVTTPNVYIRP